MDRRRLAETLFMVRGASVGIKGSDTFITEVLRPGEGGFFDVGFGDVAHPRPSYSMYLLVVRNKAWILLGSLHPDTMSGCVSG